MGHYNSFLEEDLQKNTVNLLWASKITHVGSKQPFLFWLKTHQKATLPNILAKIPFFLKINSSG
jgi:hypothetical protein